MGKLCYKCENYKKDRVIHKCIECLTPSLYPLDPIGCKLCTKPTDYEYCWSCNNNFIKGNFRLTDLIPISYNTKSDDLTFLLIGFKNKGFKASLMGLVSVLHTFLAYNYSKISDYHGGFNYITYMPSYDDRNHSETILKKACKPELNVYDLLTQVKPMPKHKGSGADTRVLYEDVFTVNADVNSKNVLLFDDIFTTGSTMSSAAHALFQAGANKVVGLVLARVIGNDELLRAEQLKAENEFNFEKCKYDYPY